jgi:hypothetical protein
MKKTVAFDFDGVIHKYSKGWQTGEIYDDILEGALKAISDLFEEGYSVFILSTRSPKQIHKWLSKHLKNGGFMRLGNLNDPDEYPGHQYWTPWCMSCRVIPRRKKFWNDTRRVIGITNRKLAATVYIDDRALRFDGSFENIVHSVKTFKTYQEC